MVLYIPTIPHVCVSIRAGKVFSTARGCGVLGGSDMYIFVLSILRHVEDLLNEASPILNYIVLRILSTSCAS